MSNPDPISSILEAREFQANKHARPKFKKTKVSPPASAYRSEEGGKGGVTFAGQKWRSKGTEAGKD